MLFIGFYKKIVTTYCSIIPAYLSYLPVFCACAHLALDMPLLRFRLVHKQL